MDTKPVPVVGYKRDKRQSDFTGSTDYGWCASQKMNYFGYKLVLIITLKGIPLVYFLVPASTDERLAAQSVLECVRGCRIKAFKGFIGGQRQSDISKTTGNQIFTPYPAKGLPTKKISYRCVGRKRSCQEGFPPSKLRGAGSRREVRSWGFTPLPSSLLTRPTGWLPKWSNFGEQGEKEKYYLNKLDNLFSGSP